TTAAKRSARRQLFIVTESLFGMDGDLAPLSRLTELAARYDAQLIVDEAHATGCFGTIGSGCVDAEQQRSRVLATVHTGGKALGVPGAYVCGSRQLKELLVNRCRHFVYTTALPPAVGAWWLAALARVQIDHDGRRHLHEAAKTFRTALTYHGLAARGEHYIVPVLLGQDAQAVEAARRLQVRGYEIRA